MTDKAVLTTYIQRTDLGCLLIKGEDRADFIQRQSTNDVNAVNADRAVTTVLTSSMARILDVLTLIEHEGTYLAVVHYPQQTAAFLKSRIFFMDKVTVEDASDQFIIFDLLGPAPIEAPPARDAYLVLEHDGHPLRLIGMGDSGIRVLASAGAQSAVEAWVGQGAPLSAAQFETFRIERGIPGPNELTEDYTPLETGLEHLVSDTKGCYTGQEVIARQITYDKVTKRLFGLKADQPLQVGAEVALAGKSVGVVSSAAESSRFGHVGLAVLKTRKLSAGDTVTAAGQNALVVKLPFSE